MLTCQRDSRLRELRTQLLHCTPRTDGGFDAILADTILYPEGGGQPADHGHIGDVPVIDVQRDLDGVVRHHIESEMEVGEVLVTVNWTRRFDHMQQHTGQHLLTAIVERELGLQTMSFHLGARECHIELDGPVPDEPIRNSLEDTVNRAIRAALPIAQRIIPAEDLDDVELRSRGLPKGHRGPIRVVEIQGIDSNTCGGTHVRHTGELGVLLLTRWVRYRAGSRLYFLVGARVRKTLHESLRRSTELTRILDGGPDHHVELVGKLVEKDKNLSRSLKHTRTALAEAQARALSTAPGPFVHHHQADADMGQLRTIATRATQENEERVLLLTSATGDGSGVFLLVGHPQGVARLGPEVARMVNGRGGGAGGRFQGKGTDIRFDPDRIRALEGMLNSE